jgi:hypothetical protein
MRSISSLLSDDCPVMVFGRHVDDAVRVDVEGDLDLRHAPRCRREFDQLELAERLVERRHLTLALQHVDLDRRLAVFGGGEHLGAAGGNRRIALDELGHDPALGLDAERQRRDIEEEHVFDLALQHAGLHRRTDCDHLVRVDALVRLLAGHAEHELLHGRHAGRAAHEHHMVDVALGEAGVFDRLVEHLGAALEQVRGHLLELRARERVVEMERALGGRGDERQVDLGLLHL